MQKIVEKINSLMHSIGREVKLMEVCGTHTVAIFRHGIRNIIPKNITLLSGPGCPVCVTAIRDVDAAIAISQLDNYLLTTFGDMMRVPGSRQSFFHAQAEGAHIKIVYSPMDALNIAKENKNLNVVFFATGFETTSPSIAATLMEAERRDIVNFSIYSTHKLVPPAMKALLDSGDVKVQGFFLPGHVCAITGSKPYEFIATDYRIPSVVTGFEATDVLEATVMLLEQIASNKAAVEIQYKRVVKEEGNQKAISLLNEYFEPCDADWRGIGIIPKSGLKLREKYRRWDVSSVFQIDVSDSKEQKACQCGAILRGVKIPTDCPLFGKTCTPEHPVGACMVSTEGSCAAYYKYSGVFHR